MVHLFKILLRIADDSLITEPKWREKYGSCFKAKLSCLNGKDQSMCGKSVSYTYLGKK